ncbi:MAG: type II toxin-antitoxin system RelE/ParE family toxin [Oscillospiraceae bacterium]|nr:type II toxin-antitoxin system RelE/ParE family toxin [Oscillospiraceae bacterium]
MDDKYEVVITKKCKISLNQICGYIKNILDAEIASNNLLDKFEQLIKTLEVSPFIYQKVERYKILDKEYRKVVIKNYIVIYDVDEENKKVYLDNMFYGGSNYINKI